MDSSPKGKTEKKEHYDLIAGLSMFSPLSIGGGLIFERALYRKVTEIAQMILSCWNTWTVRE